MESFIHVAGWAQHAVSTSPASRPLGHLRSLSSITRSASPRPPRTPTKATSISELPRMSSSLAASPSLTPSRHNDDVDELNTLPDPRSRAMSPAPQATDAGDDAEHASEIPPAAGLDDEVAALSAKLVSAINHQTSLDDTLGATRQELESARRRIRELEDKVARQQDMLSGEVWVRRKTAEAEKRELQAKATEEKKKRVVAEKEKTRIEQELESLSVALFEEANKMVVVAKEEAKKEYDALLRKNDQLKAQIADTEGLLKSQQDQLAELKLVMETMRAARDDQTSATAPSSPGFSKFDADDGDRVAGDSAATSPLLDSVSPTHPTSFSHLLQPVLRTDLSTFDDFVELVRLSRQRAMARLSSGSQTGLAPLRQVSADAVGSAHPSNASASSLTGPSQSPQTPGTPASSSSPAAAASPGPAVVLKDTKFFKRVLAEDIEPTLRLDLAPSLKWLSRGKVLNAMTDGSLVVEPVPNTPYTATVKPQHYPCSLCGESRRDEPHLRTHRFRTSESDSAQRYPLCRYCLGRVRSTCDFLGFLRILKDGHWRADDEDAEKAAWEESVRLREQMFWSRIGGGVVPAGHPVASDDSDNGRRASQDDKPPRKIDAETASNATFKPALEEPAAEDASQAEPQADEAAGKHTPAASVRNSTQSLGVKESPSSGSTKRLSITIPHSSTDGQ